MSSGKKSSSTSSSKRSSSNSPKSTSSSRSRSSSKTDSKPKYKHLHNKKLSEQDFKIDHQQLLDRVADNNDCVFHEIQFQAPQFNNGHLELRLEQVSNALKEAFDFFDIDRDGRITSTELHQVLKLLDTPATKEEAVIMITDADSDGNGSVEFNEFLKLMNRYNEKHNLSRSDEDEVREVFKIFDQNGDSYIDFDEIKKTMNRLGERVTDEDVNAMITEADMDHDGKINFEEFKQMMTLMRQKVAIGEQLAI